VPDMFLTLPATAPYIVIDASVPAGYRRATGDKPITFAVIGCDDDELALYTSSAYMPSLAFLPEDIVTWGHYWEEPTRDSDGLFHPQDIEVALRSFIFYESPPSVSAAPDAQLAALYTPFKRFTFSDRTVTCNMPFYTWGTGTNQTMVEDVGETDSTGNFTVLPLQRHDVGQVLAANLTRMDGASLNTLEFTLKIHRSVRFDDSVYPYFAIFDASAADVAFAFGVPQSGRLIRAGLANLENSVSFLQVISNGVPCMGCSPFGDWQEPVADSATIVTPLHQLDVLLWDCDLTFPASPTAFSDDLDQACPGAAADAVDKMTIAQPVIYNPDVESVIDDRRVYQFVQPPLYANSPFIAQLTVNPPTPVSPPVDPWVLKEQAGTTYIIIATESARFWSLVTLPTMAFQGAAGAAPSPQAYVQFQPTNPPSMMLGGNAAVVLPVMPADRVIFYLAGDNLVTPNGVVFGDIGIGHDSETDVDAFFDLNPVPVSLNEATNPRFLSAFQNAPFGYTHSSLGPLVVFDGYVKENAVGTTLFFTSYTYGPQFMSGALVVTENSM